MRWDGFPKEDGMEPETLQPLIRNWIKESRFEIEKGNPPKNLVSQASKT